MNMLENFTPLTVQTASGPLLDILGEARPDKGSQNQSPGMTNTRVRDAVERVENSALERNRNYRTGQTSEEVTEDRGPTRGHRDKLVRRVAEKSRSFSAGQLQDREQGRRWKWRRTGESVCYHIL